MSKGGKKSSAKYRKTVMSRMCVCVPEPETTSQ